MRSEVERDLLQGAWEAVEYESTALDVSFAEALLMARGEWTEAVECYVARRSDLPAGPRTGNQGV